MQLSVQAWRHHSSVRAVRAGRFCRVARFGYVNPTAAPACSHALIPVKGRTIAGKRYHGPAVQRVAQTAVSEMPISA
jgi:hypothetical protein